MLAPRTERSNAVQLVAKRSARFTLLHDGSTAPDFRDGLLSGGGNQNRHFVDRKSTRLNSSHVAISYAVFCLNAPPPTELHPLSLHDALPICLESVSSAIAAADASASHRKVKRRAVGCEAERPLYPAARWIDSS